ncbi:MAG TPA: FtsQ-type POTRA domain-containing protein, partial [Candidatus Dormibacteraeota bacterium]|nr:FtsQ-type POTRA domain-containing protein [Candidatus Dormibacteraeota bacterium]
MSTAVLDEIDQRRASVRAQAAAIADSPRAPRRFSVPPGTRLRPSPRRRSHTRPKPQPAPKIRSRTSRRLLALAVLLVQIALLVLALTLPAFRVRSVTVAGTRLVSADAVLQAAAVPQQSIFTLDASTIRARVLALPWVQDASVTTELPNRVHLTVRERVPAVRLRRLGADTFVADNGASLPADANQTLLWGRTPALLDDRAGSTLPLDPTLLRVLEITAQRFPAVFGCGVAAFQWGVDDVFSVWTTTGWRVVLGHLDTADALAQVPAQLAALGALKGQLDFTHPSFGYIDVENPAGPAAAGSPGLPAEVLAANTPLPPPTSGGAGTGGAA